MTYNVDLREKITGDSVTTMLETDNYDKAWEFADNYNNAHGITADEYALLESEESEGWTPHPYWASVYEIETENKEDNTMDYRKEYEKAKSQKQSICHQYPQQITQERKVIKWKT